MAVVIIFIGSIVQGSFGLGGALVAAPLLLLINPIFVPLPILTSFIVLTALVAIKDRQSIQYQDLKFIMFGRVLGTIPAIMLMALTTGLLFEFVFAVIILMAVLISLIGANISINRTSLTSAGIISGFMGTISSIGGPPIALVYQSIDSSKFRATLSMQMMLGSMFSVVLIVIWGIDFGQDDLIATLILLPGGIFGFFASRLFVNSITRAKVRFAVLSLSGFASILVLTRATLTWFAL